MRCFVLLLFLEGCLCCFGYPSNIDPLFLVNWLESYIWISCQISNTYAGLHLHGTVEDYTDSTLYDDYVVSQSYMTAMQTRDVPQGVELRVHPGTTVREGQKLSLECTVKSSNPDVLEYQWWRNTHKIDGKITGNRMEIDPVGRQHPGRYRCKARNELGTAESGALDIVVQYPPKQIRAPFDHQSWTINENETITLQCSFIANPPITIYEWYKNHARINIGSQKELHFQAIQHSDSGTYYCKAHSPIGSSTSSNVTLDVLSNASKGVKLSANPGTTVREGERLSLECTLKNSNLAILEYQWWKNNQRIKGTSGSRMEIDSVGRQHSARYRCGVRNTLGTTESKELTIDVHYPPEEPKVAFSRMITQGQDVVTLQCLSTANPPITHYEWYKCSSLDIISTKIGLSFPATQPSDSGGYYCKAYNPIGYSTSSVLTLSIH